jgi:hypothetical protein
LVVLSGVAVTTDVRVTVDSNEDADMIVTTWPDAASTVLALPRKRVPLG